MDSFVELWTCLEFFVSAVTEWAYAVTVVVVIRLSIISSSAVTLVFIHFNLMLLKWKHPAHDKGTLDNFNTKLI